MLPEFEINKEILVSHDFSVFSDIDGAEIYSYFRYMELNGYEKCRNIKGCTMAFNNNILENIGFPHPDNVISHDYYIALVSYFLGQRNYIDVPLILHRIHGMNTSGHISSKMNFLSKFIIGRNTKVRSRSDELMLMLWLGVDDRNLQIVKNLYERSTPSKHVDAFLAASEFILTPGYQNPLVRFRSIISNFLKGRYASCGSLYGIYRDIRGTRRQ